jgi:FMN phosphatase YigB (HAD superfamily)
MFRKKIEAVFLDLGDTLVTSERQWVPGAKVALQRFKLSGVRLGIISNTGTFTRQQLLDQLLPTDFQFKDFEEDLIILSSEVNIDKPDAQIFGFAIDQAAICPHAILFCGENLTEVLAAQCLGLNALQVAIEKQKNGPVTQSSIEKIAKDFVTYNQI